VVRLSWSSDPWSYACSCVATGGVSHARQVKGDDPDKKGYLALQVGSWTGADNLPHKYYSVEELLKLDAGCLRTILEEATINQ